jgi:hypothetical protein
MLSSTKAALFKLMSFWPPYLGAGIRVQSVNRKTGAIVVEMDLYPWNRNYVGTHFGGSLYTMCDPFFMLLLIELLGKDYIIWDKKASIEFKKPGRGKVHATFCISPEQIEQIKEMAEKGKVEPVFKVKVVNQEGETVAEVKKLLYVKKKPKKDTPTTN